MNEIPMPIEPEPGIADRIMNWVWNGPKNCHEKNESHEGELNEMENGDDGAYTLKCRKCGAKLKE